MSIKERIDAMRKGEENDKPEPDTVDVHAVIIGGYLRGFVPVDTFGPGVFITTTDEIISALSEMADVSQSEVNRALVALGYKPGRNSAGIFGWMMKHVE